MTRNLRVNELKTRVYSIHQHRTYQKPFERDAVIEQYSRSWRQHSRPSSFLIGRLPHLPRDERGADQKTRDCVYRGTDWMGLAPVMGRVEVSYMRAFKKAEREIQSSCAGKSRTDEPVRLRAREKLKIAKNDTALASFVDAHPERYFASVLRCDKNSWSGRNAMKRTAPVWLLVQTYVCKRNMYVARETFVMKRVQSKLRVPFETVTITIVNDPRLTKYLNCKFARNVIDWKKKHKCGLQILQLDHEIK